MESYRVRKGSTEVLDTVKGDLIIEGSATIKAKTDTLQILGEIRVMEGTVTFDGGVVAQALIGEDCKVTFTKSLQLTKVELEDASLTVLGDLIVSDEVEIEDGSLDVRGNAKSKLFNLSLIHI